MNGPIDFAEINRAALAVFPVVLARVMPGDKRATRASVPSLSRSIRAVPITVSDRYGSIDTTDTGLISRPATRAATHDRVGGRPRRSRRSPTRPRRDQVQLRKQES
jgi:hypothetical protein